MAKNKVALIGASGYATNTETHRLDSFGWHQLDKLSNVRDYSAIVISLLDAPPAENNVHVWDAFTAQLNQTTCREITSHGGKLIIIGDPRFQVSTSERTNAGMRLHTKPFLDFMRGNFAWDQHGGDSVNIANVAPDGVREYLSHLRHWNYALRDVVIQHGNVKLLHTAFAHNRYGLVLAGSFLDHGNLYLLPAISLTPDATIRLVLQQIVGVELAEDAEPAWAGEIVVSGQTEIDRALAESESQIERLKQSHNQLCDQREAVREPVRLLYLRGMPLEQIVRKTMAALGATVREPTEAGDEDGWIEYDGRHGVLEVKSANGATFGEDGIAQLTKWILKDADLNAKGIFVGLASAGQRPSEASPFGSNFARNAARFEIVAMQTKDLFLAHELMRQGKLTPAEFWPTVFDTNGIYSDAFLKAKSQG